jgi:hypothetical protein
MLFGAIDECKLLARQFVNVDLGHPRQETEPSVCLEHRGVCSSPG